MLSVNTTKALAETESRLYGTTTYQLNYGGVDNLKNDLNKKKTKNFQSATETRSEKCGLCKYCSFAHDKKRPAILNKTNQMKKYAISPNIADKYVWPCWPLGGNNITNNSPVYPKIILPKYCFPQRQISATKKAEHQCCCGTTERFCDGDKAETCCEFRPVELEEHNPKGHESDDLLIEERHSDTPPESAHTQSGITAEPGRKTKKTEIFKGLSLNEQLYALIISKPKQNLNYERGFKTDAHYRYHKKYPDRLPDLRDATTQGRKHHYCGINVHLFRG